MLEKNPTATVPTSEQAPAVAVSQKATTDARHEGSSEDIRPELRDNDSVSESNEDEVL